MTASDTSTELRFEPPGPGSWEQDPVHFPRPMTRYFQETHPPAFKKGTNDFARSLGAGATAQETLTVQSADLTASQVLTVTIQGSDDRAVFDGTTNVDMFEDGTGVVTVNV